MLLRKVVRLLAISLSAIAIAISIITLIILALIPSASFPYDVILAGLVGLTAIRSLDWLSP
jgi:hypothetical protein